MFALWNNGTHAIEIPDDVLAEMVKRGTLYVQGRD
jgi:hypothetical protein